MTGSRDMFPYELIRSHFWALSINQKARESATRKGKARLRECSRSQLKRLIGAASPYRDGMQTSKDENSPNAIYFAQHATATCCRKCLEYWHGVKRGTELSSEQLEYATDLVMNYLIEKIPDLSDTRN